jgi:nucleotide-binding universal stress UspA family protein
MSDTSATGASGAGISDTSATGASGAGIVVGLDGSTGSTRALHWAVSLTDHFGQVTPVWTWQIPWWASGLGTPGVPSGVPLVELQERAERELHRVIADVPADRLAEPIVVDGPAGPTLIQVSTGANLLVVGTRGRNAVTDRLLGSVSSYCAAHSTGTPVAVVPSGAPLAAGSDTVVVGVDGSANATAALRWTLERLPGCQVVAAGCWGLETYGGFEYPALPVAEIQAGAADALDKTITLATDGHPEWRDRVRGEIRHGDPRWQLRELAAEADLLVLGARGHRGLAHVLLGSVTTSLIHQPVVPTIVVPGSADEHES